MSLVFLLVTSLIFLSPLYLIYRPPNLLIRYFQYRWPDVLFHVPLPPRPSPTTPAPSITTTSTSTDEKLIALTIDDSPSDYTSEILQVLRANDATATFFVIGDQIVSQDDETTLQELILGGNELANHAMHDEPSHSLSEDDLCFQIRTVQARIQDVYASTFTNNTNNYSNNKLPPKYFRPGSGFFHSRMRRVVAGLGYRIILGSVYPHDPFVSVWRVNAMHILSMLRPGGIIVCHDRRKWTVPMLAYVLPVMKRRGYKVVTVTELLEERSRSGC